MTTPGTKPRWSAPGARALDRIRQGPLGAFLKGAAVMDVHADRGAIAAESQDAVLAPYCLQDEGDYRRAIQAWFALVRPGGHLAIVVPHAFLYERQASLPSRFNPAQRRLYTPGSLLQEVEEALDPNSYRVRFVGDHDEDYDYAIGPDAEPAGASDVLLAIEKIERPAWGLSAAQPFARQIADAPDYAFEPARTRMEFAAPVLRRRVLILKLDHLGDFILSLGALERARAVFADAEITLVVGSWNADMARAAGFADKVIEFDVFPRNSSEEEVDVAGKRALFAGLIKEDYDLAIDLRTDTDTRFLLRGIRAEVKAGIGTRAQFPYLDIFLPLDFTRNEAETAREDKLSHHDFASQGHVRRMDHRSRCEGAKVERDCAIIWGPYWTLRPGRYIFEPFLEIDDETAGLVLVDIAIDIERRVERVLSRTEKVSLAFEVDRPGTKFEFRIWTVGDEAAPSFDFYGGRLIREGAASVLHQSEYQMLLIELIAIRARRNGILAEAQPHGQREAIA